MKKINLGFKILDINDKPVKRTEKEDWTLQMVLPDAILEVKESNSITKLLLAQKIAKAEKEIEVEEDDLILIKKAVEDMKLFNSEAMNTLFQGRVQLYLEDLKK
jgi:hypothetical protein